MSDTDFAYLGLDPNRALDRRDALFVVDLKRIGETIGYGRAQQLLGLMWDHEHGCAPRGSMGVTVKDKRPGHNKGKKFQRDGRLAYPAKLGGGHHG